MTFPSLEGVSPRSEERMAFSMAAMAPRSWGCTTSRRGSGTENDARSLRETWVP